MGVNPELPVCSAPAELAAKFAALSHPARIAILARIAGNGVCSCKDVVDSFDLAQSTVSQHLKVLVEAGLLRYAADRQRSRYELDRASLAALSDHLNIFAQACCRAPSRREKS